MLKILFDQGMNFTVIEGFKQIAFPRIVIGDLKTDHSVLTNPCTDDVLASLDDFEDFVLKD
jgi:molybdopterin-guanine dinucleotide biosynthesis protein